MATKKKLRDDLLAQATGLVEGFWQKSKGHPADFEKLDEGLRALALTDLELRYLKARLPRNLLPQSPQARRVSVCTQALELIEITNEDR